MRFRERIGSVEMWFTDADDGDLTDPATIATLRDRLDLSLLSTMRQVHGADAVWAYPGVTPEADAILTYAPGQGLLVRVADCVPVVLVAGEGDAVAVVHAGRQGLVAGVVTQAATVLREHQSGPVTAWTGPHICGDCYELDAGTAAQVATAVPEAASITRWGTPAADIGAGVRAQLAALDVDVRVVGGCTLEDERYFSHRRDATTKRQGAVVVIR